MLTNEPYDGRYQEYLDKLSERERNRREIHGESRIISVSKMSPLQIYQNVKDNSIYVFENRVPTEGTKVIKQLKGVGAKRRAGIVIQLLSLVVLLAFLLYLYFYKSIDLGFYTKLSIVWIMFAAIPILLIVGGCIRISGRKLLIDYLDVWNTVARKGPVEINCLTNGQLAIIKYCNSDKSQSRYPSALDYDDTIWHGTTFNTPYVSTFVDYIYIIDNVKSCTKTKNGIMIETSGTSYGKRVVRSNSDFYCVFAKTDISYRVEEIPAILTDMQALEAALSNYGNYESGSNAFSPLKL